MIFAYIDPGAGSLLIQAVVAVVGAAPFLLRSKLRALIDRWRR